MTAALAVTPSSDVEAGSTVCKVAVSGGVENTLTGYDVEEYPASPEVRYYLTFELAGDELGRSYVFGVNADGEHEFNNYVFPEAGSWTVRLSNAADDSSVQSTSVTVS